MCTPLLPCVHQSARRIACRGLALRTASAATPSAWEAVPPPTTTRRARPACITSTRAAASPTVRPTATSSRAGAASAPSSVPKSTWQTRTASSFTAGSACLSVRQGTRAPHPTGRLGPSHTHLGVSAPVPPRRAGAVVLNSHFFFLIIKLQPKIYPTALIFVPQGRTTSSSRNHHSYKM